MTKQQDLYSELNKLSVLLRQNQPQQPAPQQTILLSCRNPICEYTFLTTTNNERNKCPSCKRTISSDDKYDVNIATTRQYNRMKKGFA